MLPDDRQPPQIRRPRDMPEEIGGPLFPNRVASRLSGIGRRSALSRREDLLVHLDEIDRTYASMAEERLDVIDELVELRDALWPEIPWQRGRRPPAIEGAPLPAAAGRAIPLAGHALRRGCLQVIARHGPLSLIEIHAWLHRYGYVVGGEYPVKTLADALGHEHDAGRARRISRGVYELDPGFTPTPGGAGDPLSPHGDPPMDIDLLVDPPLRR